MKNKLMKQWEAAFNEFNNSIDTSNEEIMSGDSIELDTEFIFITIDKVIYESSIETLAESLSKTKEDLLFALTQEEPYKATEILENSFKKQDCLDYFFSELNDGVISMTRIGLLPKEALNWTYEFKAKYPNVWELLPDLPCNPILTACEELPDLHNYSASYFAFGEY